VGNRLKFLQIFALLLASCAGPTPELAHDAEQDEAAEIPTLGLEPGQPALTEPVLSGGSKLLDDAKAQRFALAKLCDRKVIVDHPDQTMSVTYCLEPGPKTYLGRAIFLDAGDVKQDFLQTLVKWEPGELYSKELIDDTRDKLIQTRLFVSARVELGDKLDADGTLPVTFKLAPRKPHTITAPACAAPPVNKNSSSAANGSTAIFGAAARIWKRHSRCRSFAPFWKAFSESRPFITRISRCC